LSRAVEKPIILCYAAAAVEVIERVIKVSHGALLVAVDEGRLDSRERVQRRASLTSVSERRDGCAGDILTD
jgi:hypothetical protein